MALTDTLIRNTEPGPKLLRLTDASGLVLHVQPNGSRWWRLRYRFAGKGKMLSLGTYPAVSLKAARLARDQARALLAQGIDPSVARQEAKQREVVEPAHSFESVARRWWAEWREVRSPRHANYVMRRLEADIFPVMGAKPIAEITAPLLLTAVKKIEDRGALDIAKRAFQKCGQVMRYAIAHGLAERNPAAEIKPSDALKPRKKTHYARLPSGELPEFLCKINGYDGQPLTRLALQLMSLTFVRTSELIYARWDEFEIEARIWRIPATRMKMRTAHIVPLSRQAMAILEAIQRLSGQCPLLFPSERGYGKSMSNNTLLYALYRMGYHSRMTGHGFRGIASTILHEQGYPHEHIELQLAHQARNAVSASYNHAQYLAQRTAMMQWWGDYLDQRRQSYRPTQVGL